MGIENQNKEWGKPSESHNFTDEEAMAEAEKMIEKARDIDAEIKRLEEKKKELLTEAGTIGGGNVNDQINKEFYGMKE